MVWPPQGQAGIFRDVYAPSQNRGGRDSFISYQTLLAQQDGSIEEVYTMAGDKMSSESAGSSSAPPVKEVATCNPHVSIGFSRT
jgi:hypothetical protein